MDKLVTIGSTVMFRANSKSTTPNELLVGVVDSFYTWKDGKRYARIYTANGKQYDKRMYRWCVLNY